MTEKENWDAPAQPGRRHYGSYDITALTSAVRAAKAVAAAPG